MFFGARRLPRPSGSQRQFLVFWGGFMQGDCFVVRSSLLAKTRFLYFITANPFLPANTETGCRHRRIAVLYLALILQFSGEER
jgi:hypothetical protein